MKPEENFVYDGDTRVEYLLDEYCPHLKRKEKMMHIQCALL